MSKTTLVTGLWDIKRSNLGKGWNRSFDKHYIPKFVELLETPDNLIIFGDEKLKEITFKYRTEENTQFVIRDLDWFKNEAFSKIQKIRNNPDWYNQAGWLPESTQAKLEYYNPIVMSKVFLLNDARILDKFNSDNLYWIDAGITSTVHKGYLTSDKVIQKIGKKSNSFNFICFPYEASTEIHGFTFDKLNQIAGNTVKLVGRGGFFGGPVDTIERTSTLYYNILHETLDRGLMGTEESLFSILLYRYPDFFSYNLIDGNGLISKYFEDVKNNQSFTKNIKGKKSIDYSKVANYVISYNSPDQFETLCKSFEVYDVDYLKLPKKYLLNNSLDRSTDKKYRELCEKYGFEEIKKDNLGICGGRQFVAEHFDKQNDLDFCLFFEDDMFFYNGKNNECKNGFLRKTANLYKKSLDISFKEDLDYLKLNFTEFYGDNTRQWSWYNVPQDIKNKLFPDNKNEAPFLNFSNIKSHKRVPYALGDIYYCNWPQVVSKEGNKKMFLDTKWDHPYEQTWMSHIYQETIKGNISTGILLMTPTEHDRFDFYPKEERREN